MRNMIDSIWSAFLLLAAAAGLGILIGWMLFAVGCGTAMPAVHAEGQHVTSIVERWVNCMAKPPAVQAIDWPTPDRMGNFIMHESTATRIKEAYAEMVGYTDEQYQRCRRELESTGHGEGDETTVTTEVEP